MPIVAAQSLLHSAQIEPYTHWTFGALRRVCRHLDVLLLDATLPIVLMAQPRIKEDWDATLLEVAPACRAILYHPSNTRTRRFVFSVAHELGHHVMGHPPDPPAWAERQADQFAAALLMPECEMREFYRRGWTVGQIARAKGVSVTSVEIRMKELRHERATTHRI